MMEEGDQESRNSVAFKPFPQLKSWQEHEDLGLTIQDTELCQQLEVSRKHYLFFERQQESMRG